MSPVEKPPPATAPTPLAHNGERRRLAALLAELVVRAFRRRSSSAPMPASRQPSRRRG